MPYALILVVGSFVIFEARSDAAVAILVATAAGVVVVWRLRARAHLSAVEHQPRETRIQPLRLLAFIPWFLAQSAAGGLDVAVRAFRGRGALRPGLIQYTTRIRQPFVRVVFANTVTLMPGTLTSSLRGRDMVVHTLDERADVGARLAAIEARVCRAFGEAP